MSDLREVIEHLEETGLPRTVECSLEEKDTLWMQKFPQGSRQYFWCMLYLYKPSCNLYGGTQPMIEHPRQAPEEVCVQDGLVCGNCFRLGTEGCHISSPVRATQMRTLQGSILLQ